MKNQKKIQVRFDRALNNNINSYYFTDNGSQNFTAVVKQKMTKILIESVKKFGSIKVNIIYSAKFMKEKQNFQLEFQEVQHKLSA